MRSQGSLRSHGSSSFRSQAGGSLRAPCRPGPSSGSSYRGYPGVLPGITGGAVCSVHGGGREPVRRTASSPASDSYQQHYPLLTAAAAAGAFATNRGALIYGQPTTSSSSSHGGGPTPQPQPPPVASTSRSPSSLETATRTDSLQGASSIEAEIT